MSRPHTTLAKMALGFLATALFGAVSGCSSDSYYCDANGCYYCDGVGCRPVEPPTRATCAGDYQCTTGQVCTELGCTVSCANESDCAQGWVCRGATSSARGLCVRPTETDPVRRPGVCQRDTDCVDGGVCTNGLCARPTCNPATQSCPCTTDTQCTNGQICLGGACSAPSAGCRFNSQCGTGRVCINSECRSSCAAGAACPDRKSVV